MAIGRDKWRWAGACLAIASGLVIGFGCKRDAAVPDIPAAVPPAAAPLTKPEILLDPRLHQSFMDATRKDPPDGWPRPPDETSTGKSVGKLYVQVTQMWKSIRFATAEGKRIQYRAVLETDQGSIEIQLLPDVAPNHVRNFIALARVGYYDGLMFDSRVHQVSQESKETLDMLVAGSPLGVKDRFYDGIGYWLKPEFNAQIVHEEGTIGAYRGEEADTAACRFYVTLTKAPFLNNNYTVFGKVTCGLDILRAIFNRPFIEEEDQGYNRPEKPVVIRKATIIEQEAVDNPPSVSNNSTK